MDSTCSKKLTTDFKTCPHITNATERKRPNDPDYFGEDELNFIESFSRNKRQNVQQIRHLKATSTATGKTLYWLLQGDLCDVDDVYGAASGEHGTAKSATLIREYGATKGEGFSNGAAILKTSIFDKGEGFPDSAAFAKSSYGKDRLTLRGISETGKPLVPLSYFFNETVRPVGHRLGLGEESRPSRGSVAGSARRPMQTGRWLVPVREHQGGASAFGDTFVFETSKITPGVIAKADISGKSHIFRAPQAVGDILMRSGHTYAKLLKDDRKRERERLKAFTTLYTDINEPPKVMDKEEQQRESEGIYKLYANAEQVLKDELQQIEKLNFAELIEILKKEGHTKYEPVLFHEPFDREKPWTWMHTFPLDIPKKYLKRLSGHTLMVLRDWQTKQKLAKAEMARKKRKSKRISHYSNL